jgi:hypothetical protein
MWLHDASETVIFKDAFQYAFESFAIKLTCEPVLVSFKIQSKVHRLIKLL